MQPKELADFRETLPVDRAWSASVGDGSEFLRLGLAPAGLGEEDGLGASEDRCPPGHDAVATGGAVPGPGVPGAVLGPVGSGQVGREEGTHPAVEMATVVVPFVGSGSGSAVFKTGTFTGRSASA